MEIKSKINYIKKNKVHILFELLKIIVVFSLFYVFNNVKIVEATQKVEEERDGFETKKAEYEGLSGRGS